MHHKKGCEVRELANQSSPRRANRNGRSRTESKRLFVGTSTEMVAGRKRNEATSAV